MQFTSLPMARAHLRLDTNDEDNYVQLLIESASGAVYNYIKGSSPDFFDSTGAPYEDSNGIADVPAEVQNATLLLIGYLHKDRDTNGGFVTGYLPAPVSTMLYRYRMPGLR